MTQVDQSGSVKLRVTINGSSFNGTAPADGFIDPTEIISYTQLRTYTGSTTTPSSANGDTFLLNGVSITLGSNANGTGIASNINALTDLHHVLASVGTGGNLILINEPLFENFGIQFSGSTAVISELGMTSPTIGTPNGLPTTLALSTAKSRANARWDMLTKLLGFEVTPVEISAIRTTGTATSGSTDVNTQPLTLSFSVQYDRFENIYTYDETNNNALLQGIPAVIRMAARALTWQYSEILPIINPGTFNSSSDLIQGYLPTTVTIGSLTSSLATAGSAVAITEIAFSR